MFFKLTVVAVAHTILKNGPPLLLLLAGHHTKVIMAGVRMPEDDGELSGTLDDGSIA